MYVLWLSVTFLGELSLSVAVYGCLWLSVTFLGELSLWLTVADCGCLCL